MKGVAMEPETTQSAELTRIEEWMNGLSAPWPDILAWMKNREATEALLLGMVEKLTPAAETLWHHWTAPAATTACGLTTKSPLHHTTRSPAETTCPRCKAVLAAEAPEPTATPQPACEHRPQMVLKAGWAWCPDCGALYNGLRWMPPARSIQWDQPPAPQQTDVRHLIHTRTGITWCGLEEYTMLPVTNDRARATCPKCLKATEG
jgi:hypothetical protein